MKLRLVAAMVVGVAGIAGGVAVVYMGHTVAGSLMSMVACCAAMDIAGAWGRFCCCCPDDDEPDDNDPATEEPALKSVG